MAAEDAAPSFGANLRDGFKPVNGWVSNNISWLDDIQAYYRERSAVEKEYSAKLNALAKRFFEKKAKKSSSLSVGDTPLMTPGSLESSTLKAWTAQLTTLEALASQRERFAADLITHLAEPLKAVGAKFEDIRKKYADYAAKLEKERDSSYAELKKTKNSYDSVCQGVEDRRKKVDSSMDFSKTKSQAAYQEKKTDMHNVKNTYLIAINVCNKQKEKYYHEYVPDLLDNLQDLHETRTDKLNTIWTNACKLETFLLGKSNDLVDNLSKDIQHNEPAFDSAMFIEHNHGGWQEPADMRFEASPVWHDDEAMVTDEDAKTFLRNMLGKSKGQLTDLKRDVDKQRKEVETMFRKRMAIREGKDNSDEVEVVRAVLSLQETLHELDRKRITAEVEISTITEAVGDVTRGSRPHDFKSQSFKIPTNCDFCGERIWGLSAKGYDCKDCGFTCHSKCEMKVPATCPGEQTKEAKKKLKAERAEAAAERTAALGNSSTNISELPDLSRSNTMNSLSSGYAASGRRAVSNPPRGIAEAPGNDDDESDAKSIARSISSRPANPGRRRVLAPPPGSVAELSADRSRDSTPPPAETRSTVLYTYEARDGGEVSVREGDSIVVLEPDDGSGWITVKKGSQQGLVPASYVGPPEKPRPASAYSAASSNTASSLMNAPGGGALVKKKGPAVAPKRGAKKLKYCEAIYAYDARTEGEYDMREGDKFVLINADTGDGWAEVELGGVIKSVPAAYIREA